MANLKKEVSSLRNGWLEFLAKQGVDVTSVHASGGAIKDTYYKDGQVTSYKWHGTYSAQNTLRQIKSNLTRISRKLAAQ